MKSDAAIQSEGIRILAEGLGSEDAARFIALANRRGFDYTEWQRYLWNDMTLDEIFYKAKEYCDEHEANRL